MRGAWLVFNTACKLILVDKQVLDSAGFTEARAALC